MNKKFFYAQILVHMGEYEVYTGYCLSASDMDSAEEKVMQDYNIGGDLWDAIDEDERGAELVSLVEVSLSEYTVLQKYI